MLRGVIHLMELNKFDIVSMTAFIGRVQCFVLTWPTLRQLNVSINNTNFLDVTLRFLLKQKE